MKFKELLDLPYVSDSDRIIDCSSLQTMLPHTPLDVIEQFFSDHGKEESYQNDYGNIEISNLSWEKVSISADKLCLASINSDCLHYFNTVKTKASWVKSKELENYRYSDEIVSHWKENMTWCRPPVFICGHIISSKSELRLVEGHTRLGSLTGFVDSKIIDPDSNHTIWLGCYK
ncbi:MAG: hypothetical protein HRT51_09435 [Colwellia sp.]|nr:hypothetical protein [Colwellia sp.]